MEIKLEKSTGKPLPAGAGIGSPLSVQGFSAAASDKIDEYL